MSYAIFKSGGKQYRVSQGDFVEVDKLEQEEGTHAVFSEVLLVSEGGAIRVGTEAQGATVEAEVVSQFKGEKVLAYQYRRRKGYHRTVGHRRRLTKLKITSIKA
jgi:large subunit ribosomal protein L21